VRLPRSADALAERPFRLLWLGQTTSAVGDSLIPVALAFAVLGLGGPRDLGIVLANAIWDTVLQREIPRAALGRVSSYD
jgi:hypothetical protein